MKPEGHRCFLQPVETLQPEQQRRRNDLLDDDVEVDNDVTEHECNLMFFDFECLQDGGKHISNLCVVQIPMMSSVSGYSSRNMQRPPSSPITYKPTMDPLYYDIFTSKVSLHK